MAALTRKLGFVYRNTNRFNESVEAYKKALAYSTQSRNLYDMATTSSNIGNIFNSFNKYDSALIYHNKTIEIARKANYKDIIVRSYMQLINSYNGLKQYPKGISGGK